MERLRAVRVGMREWEATPADWQYAPEQTDHDQPAVS